MHVSFSLRVRFAGASAGILESPKHFFSHVTAASRSHPGRAAQGRAGCPGPSTAGGAGGGRAAGAAARKDAALACPVTAVPPEPPEPGPRCRRHGGGQPQRPPGAAGGAAQVGGSLPGPAAAYCRGGWVVCGRPGDWENGWLSSSSCPGLRCEEVRTRSVAVFPCPDQRALGKRRAPAPSPTHSSPARPDAPRRVALGQQEESFIHSFFSSFIISPRSIWGILIILSFLL